MGGRTISGARRSGGARPGVAGLAGLAGIEQPLVRERHHPVRPWAAAGVVAVAILAVAFAFYYAPLEVDALDCPPSGQLVPAPESEAGAVGVERCLITSAAEPLTMSLGAVLRNGGRLPVIVEGVALDDALDGLVAVEDLRMTAPGSAPEPFAPFALGPGEAWSLEVAIRVRACDPDRGERLLTVTDLPVRTRFLGAPKTTDAPLDTELSVLRSRC